MTLSSRLHDIKDRMVRTAKAAGRCSDDVRLIAVSKLQDASLIEEALTAGHRVFGENRVQEAAAKYPGFKARHIDLELHLIGPLQTNKVEDAVRLFDVIETVDRPKLADALAKAIRKTGCNPQFYIEVNIGREPQKAGIMPEEVVTFLAYCRDTCGLRVEGLMCIPPQESDPEVSFTKLRNLGQELGLKHLSMGMSGDFETAIACGATEVRIGTALFGPRVPKE